MVEENFLSQIITLKSYQFSYFLMSQQIGHTATLRLFFVIHHINGKIKRQFLLVFLSIFNYLANCIRVLP